MRTLLAAAFMSGAFLLASTVNAQLDNNALYQWETRNGTPTYSPDPPPKGVDYVIVGPDLKPLAQQPTQMADTQRKDGNNTVIEASNTNTKTTTTQPPAKKWKPVRYANAPANNPQQIVKARKTIEAATPTAAVATPLVYESDDCLTLKREKLILESQFARAKTDAEMDSAILRLHEKSNEYGRSCK